MRFTLAESEVTALAGRVIVGATETIAVWVVIKEI